MSLEKYDEKAAIAGGATIATAQGTGYVTLVTGGERGSRIDTLVVTSSTADTPQLRLFLHGADHYFLGAVDVPAGAGLTNGSAVDFLAALAPSMQSGFAFARDIEIELAVDAAIGDSGMVVVSYIGGDF